MSKPRELELTKKDSSTKLELEALDVAIFQQGFLAGVSYKHHYTKNIPITKKKRALVLISFQIKTCCQL